LSHEKAQKTSAFAKASDFASAVAEAMADKKATPDESARQAKKIRRGFRRLRWEFCRCNWGDLGVELGEQTQDAPDVNGQTD